VSSLFQHVPHPHRRERRRQGPVKVLDAGDAAVEGGRYRRFNTKLAMRATLLFGTMECFYIAVVYGALGAIFPAHQAALLYWSNWVQLWSLPLLMVGAYVLGRAQERRNQQAFDDTEMLVHGQEQLAQHLAAQDRLLRALAAAHGVDPDAPDGKQ
jgi:hypothetical protein